jgi:hypothetical protein
MKLHRLIKLVLAAMAFLAAQPCFADSVLDWNEFAVARVVAARQPPPDGARNMAIVHLAMFEAINAVQQRYTPYAFKGNAPQGASDEAAAAAAAHTVLVKLFPADAPALDTAYGASLAKIPDGDSKNSGVTLGRQIGSECFAMRANDGVGALGPYRVKAPAGVYVPTVFPVSSEWADVKPWFMKDGAQFRPAAPPALTSSQWTRDIDEIKRIGGRQSATRTTEQTDVARFWTVTGVASWNPIVRSLAQSRNLSLLENARLFALVNMAASDSFVAVFDAKYAYEFWRPVTAIRNGGADGSWLPLVDTPLHPEYPCAHCISAGAVGEVLEAHFGQGEIPPVSMLSPTAPGVTRHWTRIADYVQEVNDARVWGGIHYRNSTRVGEDMGRQIGALAVKGYLTPAMGKQ